MNRCQRNGRKPSATRNARPCNFYYLLISFVASKENKLETYHQISFFLFWWYFTVLKRSIDISIFLKLQICFHKFSNNTGDSNDSSSSAKIENKISYIDVWFVSLWVFVRLLCNRYRWQKCLFLILFNDLHNQFQRSCFLSIALNELMTMLLIYSYSSEYILLMDISE